jgi:hypothetical protein
MYVERVMCEVLFVDSHWPISIQEILLNVEFKGGGGGVSLRGAGTEPLFIFGDPGTHPIL